MTNKVLSKATKSIGLSASHRRENGFIGGYKVFDISGGELLEVIDCRLYWPGDRCYACLWVHLGDYPCGSGYAGGYGYDKRSAAVGDAIVSAGYKLERSISGVGDEAVVSALLAISEFHGVKNPKIVHIYG